MNFLDLYSRQPTGDQEALLLSNLIYLLELTHTDGVLKGSFLLLELEPIVLKLRPILHFWLLCHPMQKERCPGDPVRKADLDVFNTSMLISCKFDKDQNMLAKMEFEIFVN